MSRDFLEEGTWFFGVFDGHGKEGHLAAQYVKNNLPSAIGWACRGKTDKASFEKACVDAHVTTNENLHKSVDVDDSLSGTTAISITFWGSDLMTICNVGDSRAIVGVSSANSDEIRAYPLSHDQTPYRKDERERVKKYGARILSLDQIEGLEPIHENWGDVNLGEELDEGGDPPRIWSPNGEFPGTAFTRSLGDVYAEELGVSAEPEVITRSVKKTDKILVIASDGVFEFLTNQSVIDMCCKFTDPLEACRAVVAEAYELWLQYELRTDDISMIAIFMDTVGATPSPSADNDRPAEEIDVTDIVLEGVKPVRRQMSRKKKKAMMKVRNPNDDEAFDIGLYVTPKTDHEKARIDEAIKASFLFQNLTPANKELLFSVMEKVKVNQGDWVITQGDEGDRFYIVDNGKFEVRIQDESKVPHDNADGGKIVHVYESSNAHPSFGELALMYSTPRAASIIAMSSGQLWALHRNVFRKVLIGRTSREELVSALRKKEIFKCLSLDQLKKLADNMIVKNFSHNEIIVKQGEGESEGRGGEGRKSGKRRTCDRHLRSHTTYAAPKKKITIKKNFTFLSLFTHQFASRHTVRAQRTSPSSSCSKEPVRLLTRKSSGATPRYSLPVNSLEKNTFLHPSSWTFRYLQILK